jgi:RNA polymerase sigma factor (sigma-70 family)
MKIVERLAADAGSDFVRFVARRISTAADAQDVAQEAYLRLLRVERKDLIRDPRAYVYRIASNIILELEIKRRADLNGLMKWSEDNRLLNEESGDVDAAVEAVALQARLESVIRELSPKCRAVLILHRRDGLTYEEISAKIAISTSMVKKYLAQGLRHCRERLKDLR